MIDEPIFLNETLQMIPRNTSTAYCNEHINFPNYKALACSCSDCTASCPVPIPPPIIKECKIWLFNCLDIVFIILFFISSLSFLAILLISKFYQEFINKRDKSFTNRIQL